MKRSVVAATSLLLIAPMASMAQVEEAKGPVSYDATRQVARGDTVEKVVTLLGKPDRVPLDACAQLLDGDECWNYAVRHPAHKQFILSIREGRVAGLDWPLDSPAKAEGAPAESSTGGTPNSAVIMNAQGTRGASLNEPALAEAEVTEKPQVTAVLVTIDTTHFKPKGGKKCKSHRPDYSKYHSIIHLLSNEAADGKSSGKKVKIYVANVVGTDPGSGERRRTSYSVNLFSGTMSMRVGEPGTRITFEGDEAHPFEPTPGLRLWNGSIDIDPECGMIVHRKRSKVAVAPTSRAADPRADSAGKAAREKEAVGTASGQADRALAADPGADFAETAAREEGAVRTASGLVFRSLAEGSGPSPSEASTVKVNYKGTFPDGSVFDQSAGGPVSFPLKGVIKCWTEGLQLMKPGGKARLVCPPSIAYGVRGEGRVIPPNATLVFEVELLAVER